MGNSGVFDPRAFEGERKRSLALVKVAWIEQGLHADAIDVDPIEASVEDVEAEVAVDDQVVFRGLVSGESKNIRGLLPSRHRGIGTVHSDEIVHKIVEIAVREFLVQLSEAVPGLDSAFGLLLARQQIEKGRCV